MIFIYNIKYVKLYMEINFSCVAACSPHYTWSPLASWNGSDPVAYRSFDNLDCLVLLEGSQRINIPLISGKVMNVDLNLSNPKFHAINWY